MATAYDTSKPLWPDTIVHENSRFRKRVWMTLMLVTALVFLGVVIWNRFTAPNEVLNPVEQGILHEQQQQAH